MNLYYNNSSTGLSVIPKIKYEHVFLTSFSKMRVDLAAQVRGMQHACQTDVRGHGFVLYTYICIGVELHCIKCLTFVGKE